MDASQPLVVFITVTFSYFIKVTYLESLCLKTLCHVSQIGCIQIIILFENSYDSQHESFLNITFIPVINCIATFLLTKLLDFEDRHCDWQFFFISSLNFSYFIQASSW